MDLNQLRTFVAVAEEGHLTRAAERLHVSQPAVSLQIKALERELGLRLFDRSPAGMALTVFGRDLQPLAVAVLASAEKLRRTARQLSGELAGTLRIGTVVDPESIRLGDLMAAVVRRYPRLELELHHEVSGAALESVREGRLDGSFFFGDALGHDFATLRLREFVYCVAAPAAWAERIEDADWPDIAALPWILTPAISTHNRLVTRLFEQQGVAPPQRRIEADHESVIESLVASGVGLALIREDAARPRAEAGEIRIWNKARLRTTLWFVCLAERAADPLLAAVFELLRETWRLPAAKSDESLAAAAT